MIRTSGYYEILTSPTSQPSMIRSQMQLEGAPLPRILTHLHEYLQLRGASCTSTIMA